MEMSSLKAQLKKLATAATDQFHVDIRKKKSLIYDSEQAAKIDLSTYYNNAKVAVEHLVNIEETLSKYRKRLFSEASVHYEPSIQELDVKAKTDQHIQDFLVKVSPFLQIPKIPLEALDWLIQRYQVHLYQPDELIRCVLPYHDTAIFPKFVQLMDLDAHGNRRWAWLRPMAEEGVPLTRDELIHVCSRNADVLLFICRTVEMHTKIFKRRERFCKPMIALFAQISLGLLSRHALDEAAIARTLAHLSPLIEAGLASPLHDFHAAATLIVHVVVTRRRLTEEVAERWARMLLSRTNHRRPETALMLASLLGEQCRLEPDAEITARVKELKESVEEEKRGTAAVRKAVRSLLGEEEEFPSGPASGDEEEEMEVVEEEERQERTEEKEMDGQKAKTERKKLTIERKEVKDEALLDWLLTKMFAGSDRAGSVVPQVYALGVMKDRLSVGAWKGEEELAKAMPQLFLLLQHDSSRVRAGVVDCLSVLRRRVRTGEEPLLAASRALRKLAKKKERQAVVGDRTYLQQAPFNRLIVQELCAAVGPHAFFHSSNPTTQRRRLEMLWRYLSPEALSAAVAECPGIGEALVKLLQEADPRTAEGRAVWALWRPKTMSALPEAARQALMERWMTCAAEDEQGASGKAFTELDIPAQELHRLMVSLLPTKAGTSAREIILRKRGRTKCSPQEVLKRNRPRLLLLLNHMRQASWKSPGPGVWSLVHPMIEFLSLVINDSSSSAPAVDEGVPQKKKMKGPLIATINGDGKSGSDEEDDSSDDSIIDYNPEPHAPEMLHMIDALLGALLVLLQSLPDSAETSDVALEPLLDCLCRDYDRQLRRAALLVVSEVARLRPALLLRGMLPLLTFMRRHVFPLDDAYTLEVIGRVLDSVIPAYIRAGSSALSAEVATVKVLEVLADSFHHVPSHRRLHLFSQLGRCVLAANATKPPCLWTLVVLLADRMTRASVQGTERVSRKRTRSRTDSGGEGSAPVLETGRKKMGDEAANFLSKLMAEFSVLHQMRACADLLFFSRTVLAAAVASEETKRSASETPSKRRRSRSRNSTSGDEATVEPELGAFASLMTDSVPLKSLSAALLFVHELDSVLAAHLASPAFLSAFVNTPKLEGVGTAVETLLQEVLQIVLMTAEKLETGEGEAATMSAWRRLLSIVYQILDKVHAFLPVTQHLSAVLRLCRHALPAVQRKSLEMLHGRLSTLPGAAGNDPHAMTALMPLLLKAVGAVEGCVSAGAESLVRQTALVCAKELGRLLVRDHGDTFVRLVERIGERVFRAGANVDAESLRSGKSAVDEEACGYALVAQLVQAQPALFADVVERLLPRLLAQLNLHRAGSHSTLHRAASLALLGSVCCFCASGLQRDSLKALVHALAGLEAEWQSADKTALSKLKNARRNLAEQAEPKKLLQSVGESLRVIVKENLWIRTTPLMQLWERHVNRLSDEAFTKLAEERISLVYKLCINALSLRQRVAKLAATPTAFSVNAAEEAGLFAVLACFRRLSTARRDDLMEMMFDWARVSQPKPILQRQIAFFRLCDCLAGRLPDDLIAACTHLELFEFASAVLTQLRSQSVEPDGALARQQDLLLRSLLSTLTAFFSSSTGLAVNAASQTLIPALVGALEVLFGGDACYRQRCTEFLLPCLAAMTEASGADETLLQPLCHQVCLRMRSPEAAVRCQSLRAMMGVVEKAGSVFEGSLLPDCLPYLAECLEDDQPEVQDLSYEVCEKIKQVCGGELDF